MSDTAMNQAKQAVREKVWSILERECAAPAGVRGRIPNFAGADAAAARLAELDVWRRARVVKANPDRAQLPVRVRALREAKLLYMAVPKLATPKPFYSLDPTRLTTEPEQVATGSGAVEAAPTVDVGHMQYVDLVVCGSVAVNRDGVRVGKGAGYSDIEVALLTEAGLMGPETTIVTTVHRLQVVDSELPEAPHDFSVDWIITPDEVIGCGSPRRPKGIDRVRVSEEQMKAIPVLGRVIR